MSAFKRNGRWVSKFQLNGRQHWTPGGPWDRKSHALEAERRYRDQLRARRTEETCASFADRWIAEWPRGSESTNRLYAAAAQRFAEAFGGRRLDEVDRLSARTWALTVPRSVSRVIGTMYEDARNVGLVEHNPFSNLRLPAAERQAEVNPPSMADYRALLEACAVLGPYGSEMRAMIQLAAWTGMRQGEQFALPWHNVGGTEIRITQSRKLDGTIGPPKNGRARTVPLLPPARVFDGLDRREDEFVFHSPLGRPLLKGTFGWSWQKVKAAAGVECRWHDLRHFCATRLLEMGLSHFDVSVQLGHTDGGALVMARYGHPSIDAAHARLLAAFEIGADDAGSLIGSKEAGNG